MIPDISIVLAVIALLILFVSFFHKLFGRWEIGGIAVCFLLLINGITIADAAPVSLIACYSLGIFYYCLKNEAPSNQLILFVVFSFLAAWGCKSIAALLTLPGLLLILILKGRLRYRLLLRTFQLSVLFSIVLVLGYYLYKENATPGHLSATWRATFTSTPNGNLSLQELLYPHFLFLIPAVLLSYFNKQFAQLTVMNCIFTLSFLCCMYFLPLKTEYSLAPVYPFLCMGWALGAAALIDLIRKR